MEREWNIILEGDPRKCVENRDEGNNNEKFLNLRRLPPVVLGRDGNRNDL